MATLLDVGILEHFGSIFVVIILFAIVFGILEAKKPFGDASKGLNAILALFVAALFLVSSEASGMIKVLVPWFVVVIIFIFFVMLMFRMFGVEDNTFVKVVGTSQVYIWIIIFAILVMMGALGNVFGQSFLEAGGGGNTVIGQPSSGAEVVIGPDGEPVSIPVSTASASTTSTTTSNFTVNLMNTLRHPKVLGMIFVLLTGAFLMIFLTKPVSV
ncbi:hypothetical protein JW711_03675 [Candidatus Woesearchaeota archaeon]|nr:hypothetical protein [Candidatus Woesearchaeota archaeon]